MAKTTLASPIRPIGLISRTSHRRRARLRVATSRRCPVRTSRRFSTFGFPMVVTLALALPATAGQGPVPVSPGAKSFGAVVEARCPTFQWAGIPRAPGYELAVFRLSEDGAAPALVTRASVPGDARGFTPPSSDCLDRGQRYAWSVAAVAAAGAELDWSTPFLFEVEAAPSLDELEHAIATIERCRAHGRDAARPRAPGLNEATAAADYAREPVAVDPPAALVHTRRPRGASAFDEPLAGAFTSPTSGVTRVASAATPGLGSPSLRISANVALGAESNLFKDDAVFLWDDTSGNTALGRNALASATGVASNNTAVGRDALRYATGGGYSIHGSSNTAVGDGALRSNTTGFLNTASCDRALFSNTTGNRNTASGDRALFSNTTGYRNTASGYRALRSNTIGYRNTASGEQALSSNTTGSLNTASGHRALVSNTTGRRNTAVGTAAGSNATGHDNIFLGSGATGATTDTNTIRIGGTSTGAPDLPGAGQQNRTFINGIRGITTAVDDAIPVLISATTGQLGTASSSRATKQDIQDLGRLADRLLELRPVAFRYRQHAATDPDTPLQFGLVAEEVAEVFPELVVFDADGRPETVRYHLLSALLLGELQRQQAVLERQQTANQGQQADLQGQRAELRLLHTRLDSIEKTVRAPSRRDGDLRSRR
jgi:hypothetical protein